MSFQEISAVFATVIGVYGLFVAADRRLRKEYRDSLSRWLKNKSTPSENWSSVFSTLFNSAFVSVDNQKKENMAAIGRPSFLRSCVASILTVVVVSLIYVNFLPESYTLSIQAESGTPPNWLLPFDVILLIDNVEVWRIALETIFVFPLVMNLIPDYLSLLQTSVVLNFMSRFNSSCMRAILLVCDFILSTAVAYFAYTILNSLYWFVVSGGSFLERVSRYSDFFIPTLKVVVDPIGNTDAIYIYSTYLTSIWLWLFLFGSLLFRLIGAMPIAVASLNKYFFLEDLIDKSPTKILGAIIAFLILVSGFIIILL